MCGRIVRERDDGYEEYFGLSGFERGQVPLRFNIAPTQEDVIIRVDDDVRRLEGSRWGLIPVWAKDPTIGSRMFNARAETLIEKTSFKSLIGKRRCIVPASGFYEWQKTPEGKVPLYIHRADGDPLILAGLYTFWRDPLSDEWLTSHTVITCEPNDFMTPIHNRMPVVLGRDALDPWLDPGLTNPADVIPFLAPCPDDWLISRAVSRRVNSARYDGPDLLEPIDDA